MKHYTTSYRSHWWRRILLRIALGKRTYEYMRDTLSSDNRTRTARMVDIVVRKDGIERRLEADWCKSLCAMVVPWRYRTAAEIDAVTSGPAATNFAQQEKQP